MRFLPACLDQRGPRGSHKIGCRRNTASSPPTDMPPLSWQAISFACAQMNGDFQTVGDMVAGFPSHAMPGSALKYGLP